MKKNFYLHVSFLLAISMSFAQNGNLKRANKLFDIKAYVEAAKIYETKKRTQEVLENLGDCYYYNGDFAQALNSYKELFEKFPESGIDREFQFKYAQSLKGNKEYKEADKYLSKYFQKEINTIAFMDSLASSTPQIFKLEEIECDYADSYFGLSYLEKDNVVFASAKNKDSLLYAWNELPYLDLYKATLSEENKLENIESLSDEINTDNHESNAIFTKDGKTMYFNRTKIVERTKADRSKIAQVSIYKAELVDGVWANIVELPFSSESYSVQHPALDKDEKTLYFASDMPGSLGSFDLYRVTINGDFYGEPENLGPKVNTIHREQFPFISEFNILYFSSNGHLGYGGLDVFRSIIINDEVSKPINLGTPVNSNFDDFAYTVLEREEKGNVSSNRSGVDRIYSFTREENELSVYQVEGFTKDMHTGEYMGGTLVTLFDESNQVIQDTIVGDDAYYIFKIQYNKRYKIRGTRRAYIPQDVEFSTNSQGKSQHNIELSLEAYSDAEENIEESEDGEVRVRLDKIYFDFDKSDIKEKAAKTLDVLVDLMKKYPFMEIEVSAHTDALGTDQYNLDLSKRRAASTLEYLVSQGIDRKRLISIGYGEMQPLNDCIEEDSDCTEAEYDINRRCEFTIIN
ncbi:OmpA family protein [uncultured Algibacter sp.]|uniref:OmpA family protein n=1 Tax=uncultured Algibacter sp. TaxID=298659 RepID=UPI00262A193D|nr:OmpA family protein [uncultured Algibacter sp.]